MTKEATAQTLGRLCADGRAGRCLALSSLCLWLFSSNLSSSLFGRQKGPENDSHVSQRVSADAGSATGKVSRTTAQRRPPTPVVPGHLPRRTSPPTHTPGRSGRRPPPTKLLSVSYTFAWGNFCF